MIVIEANYSKKLGLPGYSSHQYSVSLRTELSDLTQVQDASARLHALLQTSVDREMQKIGYLPNAKVNGNGQQPHPQNGNGHQAPRNAPLPNGQQHRNGNGHQPEQWACSPKQKKLILDIIDELRLDKRDVEKLSQERFGKAVPALNKLEASGLIEELKEQNPRPAVAAR